MSDMKHTLSLCLAAFALAACTQDELAEQGAALPEGVYPITIASVQVAEALPQTRITETSDGMGSTWNERNPDMVIVKVTGGGNDAESTYTLFGNQIIASTANLWWHTTETSSVNAWYSNLKGSNTSSDMFAVTLANQTTDNGLAYVLKADEVEANYQTENITLTFRHQLAKIRVKLEGAKAGEVTSVSVKSRTSCTVAEGNVTAGTDEGDIAMRQATYNGQTYWEANVVPDVEIKDFRLNGNVNCQLTQTVMPQAGHVHEVNINVKPKFSIVDNDGNPVDAGNINTDVTITGTCNVTLKDVSLSVGSGNAISITSGSPTIQVEGDNTITTAGSGAGIYVAQGSTVTITGSSWDDELTVTGSNGGSGIGGYVIDESTGSYANCGNIYITNVSVTSYGGRDGSGDVSPGIGCTGTASCGTITINNAEVHAFGFSGPTASTAGIGCGYDAIGSPGTNLPVVTIVDSDIYAHRGSNGNPADYIGWPGHHTFPTATPEAASAINPGAGGSIKSSTVYCYTGDTLDKTVVYDGSGVGKEQ